MVHGAEQRQQQRQQGAEHVPAEEHDGAEGEGHGRHRAAAVVQKQKPGGRAQQHRREMRAFHKGVRPGPEAPGPRRTAGRPYRPSRGAEDAEDSNIEGVIRVSHRPAYRAGCSKFVQNPSINFVHSHCTFITPFFCKVNLKFY